MIIRVKSHAWERERHVADMKRKKTFDCVEMKNRIQAERMAEYEARRDEFPTFASFIKARADESDWVRDMRAKLVAAPPAK